MTADSLNQAGNWPICINDRSGEGINQAQEHSRKGITDMTKVYGRRSNNTDDRSAISGRRINASGVHKNSYVKRRKKRRSLSNIRFSRILKAYCAILLIVLASGALLLLIYLGVYERYLPANVARDIADSFSSREALSAFLDANADRIEGDSGDLADSFIPLAAGKKIAYIADSQHFSESAPSYDITADGVPVAHLTLKEAGMAAFGSVKWDLDSLELIAAGGSVSSPEAASAGADAPSSGSPSASGNASSSDSSASSLLPPSSVQAGGSTYTYTGQADAAFISDNNALVEDALRAWALYFVYMDHSLSAYMLPGTDLYAYIFGSDSVYPIDPSLYNYEYIVDWDFPLFETSDYRLYTGECFTVEVRYKLDLTFSDEALHDDNQELDATWVWVLKDGSWKLADCIYH